MKLGSLFSGLGGIDLAFEQAGFEVAYQVENDQNCNKVLEKRWPEATRFKDVKEVMPDESFAVDVLAGGFPCQDLSVAGRRAGLAGERSGLFFEFLRVAGSVSAPWVLIENVPGLLSSNAGADFWVLQRELVERGYRLAWRVLDAQAFGVPQRRRRVFVVGHLGDGRGPAEVLFEPESCEGPLGPRYETWQEVAGTLGSGSHGPRFDLDSGGGYIVNALTADGVGTCGADDNQAQGGHLVAVSANQRGEIRPRFNHGSLNSSRSAKQFDGILAGDKVRRLTVLECERLQGLPDGFTDVGLTDTARYRMIGNSVAVPVVRWIAGRITEEESVWKS